MSAVISGVPDHLHLGNPIAEVKDPGGTTFGDYVIGDIYEYENKLFILLFSVDHDKMDDLQNILNDKSQKWLRVAGPQWSYRIPTKSSFMYIE